MADRSGLTCWDAPDRLVMGVLVKTFDGLMHTEDKDLIQLDTGYSGEVLLPYDLYLQMEFRRWQYPREWWPAGTTASGQRLELIVSRGLVAVPALGQQFEVLVDTFVNNTRFLIGRAFLRRFQILLDGPSRQVCLLRDGL